MSTIKASLGILGTLGTLFFMLSSAAPALAQEERKPPITDKTKERWARTQGGRFAIEIDVLSSYQEQLAAVDDDPDTVEVAESSRLGVAITAVAQYKIFAGLHLDAEMPFVYGSVSGRQSTDLFGERFESRGEYSRFFLGNPTIGLHYAGNLLPSLAVFGGISGTIPLHPQASSGLRVSAVANFPARAYFDTHRVLLGHMSLRARIGTEIRLGQVLYLTHDLATQLSVPTRDEGNTKFVLEQGNEFEFRPFGNFGLGIRLQAAFPMSSSNSAQLAAEPFVGWEPSVKGSFTRVGALVALDDDLGFGLDPGKVATIRVALGSKW
ncbi:hypothetical protein [Sorangium sp. So ce131]|uniref:hypothetical protein n=1 Tax=Sorangium sp. So ce131 TaxID=3133282 RepID=UPI003F5DFF0E